MAKEILTGEYYTLFDDLSMGFNDGVGYVGSVDKNCVLQLYAAIKKLMEKEFSSTNTGSLQFTAKQLHRAAKDAGLHSADIVDLIEVISKQQEGI